MISSLLFLIYAYIHCDGVYIGPSRWDHVCAAKQKLITQTLSFYNTNALNFYFGIRMCMHACNLMLRWIIYAVRYRKLTVKLNLQIHFMHIL